MTGHRSALPPHAFSNRPSPTTRAILALRYNITGKRARWAMWVMPTACERERVGNVGNAFASVRQT